MNWNLPLMLADTDIESLRERTQAISLDGTKVPDSALVREGTSNPFVAEYWFPAQASKFAGEVDFLYMAIFWISLVFFVAIVGVMVYFCFKYRRKNGVIDPQPSPSHNTSIEILWSVLPSILLVWIFYYGAESWYNMSTATDDSEEIQVTAKQFGWIFTYPDGDQSPELHLVRDKRAKLIMQSEDVLHSFFVPAFRQKKDIVPGRYSYAFIDPILEGEYRLSCNEYCGDGHSKMKTAAIVHMTEEDRKNNTEWKKAEKQPWENGQRIYQIQCSGCHKVNGEAGTGPALNLTWGRTAEFIDGTSAKANEDYIRESILLPDAKVVTGYGPVSKMNSFKGILSETRNPDGSESDLDAVIAYLKKVNEETK